MSVAAQETDAGVKAPPRHKSDIKRELVEQQGQMARVSHRIAELIDELADSLIYYEGPTKPHHMTEAYWKGLQGE